MGTLQNGLAAFLIPSQTLTQTTAVVLSHWSLLHMISPSLLLLKQQILICRWLLDKS